MKVKSLKKIKKLINLIEKCDKEIVLMERSLGIYRDEPDVDEYIINLVVKIARDKSRKQSLELAVVKQMKGYIESIETGIKGDASIY